MPLTIVVGSQYGGEGKGLISAYLSKKADLLIKIGGPNSAHSFGVADKMFRVRMIPSGANLGASDIVFPAGCLIHVQTLFDEIDMLGYKGRIHIDNNAGIVDDETIKSQQDDIFYQGVGSTLTGTGHATSRRALRRLSLAADCSILKPYLTDTAKVIQRALKNKSRVLAEGAQAYGLSNYHGNYPYVSSRDTTTGSVLAQMGIGPKYIDQIILVAKCFPTRNSGGDGYLANELDVEYVLKHKESLFEVGGGTYNVKDKQRRVGLFDFEIVERACIANTPTAIALTGLDRLSGLLHDKKIADYYGSVSSFIEQIETRYGIPVIYTSNGAYINDVMKRNEAYITDEKTYLTKIN